MGACCTMHAMHAAVRSVPAALRLLRCLWGRLAAAASRSPVENLPPPPLLLVFLLGRCSGALSPRLARCAPAQWPRAACTALTRARCARRCGRARGSGRDPWSGWCSWPCAGSACTSPSGAPARPRWRCARRAPPPAHARGPTLTVWHGPLLAPAWSCRPPRASPLTTWWPERICLATIEARRPSMCARASMTTSCIAVTGRVKGQGVGRKGPRARRQDRSWGDQLQCARAQGGKRGRTLTILSSSRRGRGRARGAHRELLPSPDHEVLHPKERQEGARSRPATPAIPSA